MKSLANLRKLIEDNMEVQEELSNTILRGVTFNYSIRGPKLVVCDGWSILYNLTHYNKLPSISLPTNIKYPLAKILKEL